MGQDFLTTVNQNIQLTMPGMLTIRNVYPTQPKEYEKDFDRIETRRNYEITVQQKMMGAARRTPEGAASAASTFATSGQKIFNFYEYTLQVNMSRILLQTNLYKESAPELGMAFLQSMIEAVNLEVADFYTNAWTTKYVGWDGKPLYGNHPVDGGVVSNTTTFYSPFNYQTFTELMTKMWRFLAPNGFLVGKTRAKVLTVAPENVPQAYTILESMFRPGTSSFERNPANGMQYVDLVHENAYIPKTQYAIRTTIPGLKFFEAWPFDIAQMPNVSTWSLLVAAFMRFSIDFDDFRASLGGRGSLAQ